MYCWFFLKYTYRLINETESQYIYLGRTTLTAADQSLLHWLRLLDSSGLPTNSLWYPNSACVCLLGGRDREWGTHWGVYCLGVFLLLAPLASQCAVSHRHTPLSIPPPPYPVFSDHLTGQLLYPSFHYGPLCLYPWFRKLLWGNHLFLFFQLFLLGYIHIAPFKTVMILI